jgi:methionine-rich copper-binding protein CopC
MRFALSMLIAALAGAALAHAEFVSSDPAPRSVLTQPPASVIIHYSMAAETRFSTFKVYRLELTEAAMPADLPELSDLEAMRLNALAAALAADVLELTDDEDDPRRVDVGLADTPRTAESVTLELQADLPAGVYVVMWEVLAIDTHWTRGHFFFIVHGS